ncbi:SAM-dependent methyltransferase [Nonomuraea sp. B5E05]|uniref:SAM-dependent methyltransferase n=1 Tax=Nonomuraea sp. B5E05 TaxID=3153569 RepID=UPI003260ED6B
MNDATAIVVEPVGTVVGGRAEAFDDDWNTEQALIRLDGTSFGPDSLTGLETFSHLEVVYQLHLVPPSSVHTAARRPRGNPDWPEVGIFAQRGKNRPNRLGVSRCRLLAVDGLDIHVRGLDAIDGTPVLDIKPYMTEFGPQGEIVQPQWSTELMRAYY